MSSDFQAEVGGRVRALRERSGLTQREFAARAGLNPAFAGRVERGLQNLTLSAIGRIAFALGVSVSTLFEGIEPGPDVLEVKPRSNARRSSSRVGPPEVSEEVVAAKPAGGLRRPSKPGVEADRASVAPSGAPARIRFLELMRRKAPGADDAG